MDKVSTNVDETRRPLIDRERRIIEKLVEMAPIEEQVTLRSSMGGAEAGSSCRCGCGSFRILIDGKGKEEQDHLAAAGFVERRGLLPLSVMLFVSKGRPTYLEIYAPERVDGDTPLELPSPDDIKA